MENSSDEKYRSLVKVIRQLIGLVTCLLLVIFFLFIYLCFLEPAKSSFTFFSKKTFTLPEVTSTQNKPVVKAYADIYWSPPDTNTIQTDSIREKILYGRKLISQTSTFFGPHGSIRKNATNGMNCQNCHLDAGTKVFGNNYGSVFATYPKYRPRSGGIENIYKRINDCFERSLNGKPLDTLSNEMQAMAAYINWLGKDVEKGKKAAGSGLKDLEFMNRAADPAKGKTAYELKCITCHQHTGAGQMNSENTAYTYPPLWGNNSFNNGAGLFRISNFAKYIKYNMPVGASHENPVLSDEEAWDIAAYVNSQPRPQKNLSKDWPKISEKPFDHPYGPFADGFSENQHKYGPYKPIKAKQEKKKT